MLRLSMRTSCCRASVEIDGLEPTALGVFPRNPGPSYSSGDLSTRYARSR
jgi:hypothetical protein